MLSNSLSRRHRDRTHTKRRTKRARGAVHTGSSTRAGMQAPSAGHRTDRATSLIFMHNSPAYASTSTASA